MFFFLFLSYYSFEQKRFLNGMSLMQVIMNIITYHTVGWTTRNSISGFRRSGVISRTRSGGDNVCKIDVFYDTKDGVTRLLSYNMISDYTGN